MAIQLRPIVFMIGIMVLVLSVAMILPAILDTVAGRNESAQAFFLSAIMLFFAGGALSLATRAPIDHITARGAFFLVVGAWMALAIVAAVPMRLSGEGLSWTDAIFEAVSGLSTTGATVITGLDTRPPGLLFWRAFLQWIGGIGIIVTAMAFWPMLGIGGMQLFQLESSDVSDKVLPKATQIATSISTIYVLLTLACISAYMVAGMPWFDAVCHAFTTLSTGGFSTSDASMGNYLPLGADLIAGVFMLLASLPFGLFILAARGKPKPLLKDAQVRGFLFVTVLAVGLLTLALVLSDVHGDGIAWRLAADSSIRNFGTPATIAWVIPPISSTSSISLPASAIKLAVKLST